MQKSILNITIKVIFILGILGTIIMIAIKPTLENILADQVRSKLVGNFQYEYSDVIIDLSKRSVIFKDVKWRFPKDTTVYRQNGSLQSLSLEGISIFSLFNGKELMADKLIFDRPELVTRIIPKKNDSDDDSKSGFDFFQLIKGSVDKVEINTLAVNHGNALWIDPHTEQVKRMVNDANIEIEKFRLNELISRSGNGWFGYSDVVIGIKGCVIFLPDSLHKIICSNIVLDPATSDLTLDSFLVVPLYAKTEMSKAYPYQTDRIDLQTGSLKLSELDIRQWMVEGKLVLQGFSCTGLDVDIFRDKQNPYPPAHRPLLPAPALQQLGFILSMDSLSITDANIQYTEYIPSNRHSIVTTFTKMKVGLSNITNDSLRLAKNKMCTGNANALIMENARMNVDLKLDLSNRSGKHWISGQMNEFDFRALNPIFEPFMHVSIKSGTIASMNFSMVLNDQKSNGKMQLIYDKLKVVKLVEKHNNRGDEERELISFFANTFLIKKSNPSGKRPAREGIIQFDRHKDKSVLNYWWKSLFTGIKSTILTTEESD